MQSRIQTLEQQLADSARAMEERLERVNQQASSSSRQQSEKIRQLELELAKRDESIRVLTTQQESLVKAKEAAELASKQAIREQATAAATARAATTGTERQLRTEVA
jgi:TolA-binding protein